MPGMNWPNNASWSAGQHEKIAGAGEQKVFTWVVECGTLYLPSGRLVVCDPFAFMRQRGNPRVIVPPGRFPVTVTLADVSEQLDRRHVREAYASIVFDTAPESYRVALPLVREGEEAPVLDDGEYVGFRVDAGTACFVDEASLATCMPDERAWLEDLFENEREDCWFRRMDDPGHIREGLANIQLPLANDGENIVIIHSGWGDGVYPVIGSFDAKRKLLAVHIDFLVVQ